MDNFTFFQDKKILVTGGAGFIGSHLCEKLLEYGAHVTAVDNFLTGSHKNIDSFLPAGSANTEAFQFIEADVNEVPETYLPTGYSPDVIFHFASPASPPRYQAHPVQTYLVNSYATHLLLQYLHKTNISGRFVFASTSEVYGDPKEHPQSEEYWGNVNPNGVRSCYDEAKRLGETICGVHARDFKMDTRILRIFNTYGPRMNLEDGRVIPDFIKQSLKNEPLIIFGDGNQTRSYCFVDDLVRGILLYAAAENLAGETINLGNPDEYSVLQTADEIYKAVQEIAGASPEHTPIEFKPLPQDDPTRRRPNIDRAKKLIGWEPTISFADGLRQTIEYFKSVM